MARTSLTLTALAATIVAIAVIIFPGGSASRLDAGSLELSQVESISTSPVLPASQLFKFIADESTSSGNSKLSQELNTHLNPGFIPGQTTSGCPDDVLISGYQTSPSDDQFVEVANAGSDPINLEGCSLVTFNVFTESSIGAATTGLSGPLSPGEARRISFPGVLPSGPAAIGIYNVTPPPPDGTPFSTTNEITGMVYLDDGTVFGISHLAVPSHNTIYDCIYGGSGQGPFTGPFTPVQDCIVQTGPTVLDIDITSPSNLTLFASSPVTVSGTVDQTASTVEVNGVLATLGVGTFSANVPLREGTNAITAVAKSTSGGIGTDSIQVILDTTPPTIVINTPGNGLVTAQSSVSVTGSVNDMVTGTVNGQDVSISCNGVTGNVQNRSFVAAGVALKPGPNTIRCNATDAASNTANSQNVQVTRQNLAGQSIELVSGDNQTSVVGTELGSPLVVRLKDHLGNPIVGRQVNFKVTGGGGTLRNSSSGLREASSLSNSGGEASVFFTLGSRSGIGNHKVSATSVGFVGEVTFLASATAASPDKILAISGDNQRGSVGTALPHPLLALVLDPSGNPLENVPVTFNVVQGGGNVNGGPSFITNTDDDGRVAAVLTLGPNAGINSNIVQANFVGNPGTPASFVASSEVPGLPQNTSVSGVVLDNSNVPIPGATVFIKNTTLQTSTDSQGQFSLSGAPVGAIVLVIDGSTSPRPETFPSLEFELTTIAGQDNGVGMPILIPALDTQGSQVCGGSADCVLNMASVPGAQLRVFANSVTFANGSTVGTVSFTQVQMDKVPMPPPDGSVFAPAWTVQPAGVHFSPPAQVTLPNTEGLPPGESADIYQFDHDLMEFLNIGPGTVSDDGSVIVSDPGFGITKAGWGGFRPPPPPPNCARNISVQINSAPQTLGVGQQDSATAQGNLQTSGSNCANVPDNYSWSSSGTGSVTFPNGNTGSSVDIEGATPGDVTLTVNYSGGGQSATDSAQIGVFGVEIVEPADNTRFDISTTPTMPTIDARARVIGVSPDPTANTTFTWSTEVNFTSRGGRNFDLQLPSSQVVGGMYTPNFGNQFAGGDLTLEACVTIGGATACDTTSGLMIRGIDPAGAAIRSEIGNDDTAKRIGCHESGGMHQFTSNGLPVEGSGGDAGIMQILFGQTRDDFWNWRTNVASGLAILQSSRTFAGNFPSIVRTQQVRGMGPFPNATNFTAQQRELEAIKRYNAGTRNDVGYWEWDDSSNQWVANPQGAITNYVALVQAQNTNCRP